MTFCYRKDPENIGDQMSCPGLYFDLGRPREFVDVTQSSPKRLISDHVVFGGGGMLYPHENISGVIERTCRLPRTTRVICWGIGSNTHGSVELRYPDFLNHADLVGIRDRGAPFEHVPCASCMSREFDHQFGIEHEFVLFSHKDFPLDLDVSAPAMSNRVPMGEFSQVVAHIASGRCVVTNSYHGAYWGLLLGRRVVVVDPFSSKFFGLPDCVAFCNNRTWKNALKRANPQPVDYLNECRNHNVSFFEKVAALLRTQ